MNETVKMKLNLQKNKTQRKLKINGDIINKKEGWIIIKIRGSPYKRGFAHGFLLRNELKKILNIFPFVVKRERKQEINEYLDETNKMIYPIIIEKYPEFFEELKGICDGFAYGTQTLISLEFIIGWNAYCCLDYKEKCSAFIATGDITKNNDIIMAHNTHSDFFTGELFNIIMYIIPDKGFPFVMQTSAGLIWSTTDWFISKSGIIGCETTIAGINYKPEFGYPCFCRIRMAMQYGQTMDDYVSIMLENNAGDYACSWLFGDINSGEIMRFEIGKKIHSVVRTFNGVYYGINIPFDMKLREEETNNHDLNNIETSSGMRNERLNYLLNDKYKGKITIEIAKTILSDHYDISLKREKMNNKTICKHSELTPSGKLFGATDGKVTTTELCRNLRFYGRFGSSCGKRNFSVKNYIKKYPSREKYKYVLRDIPKWKWTLLRF